MKALKLLEIKTFGYEHDIQSRAKDTLKLVKYIVQRYNIVNRIDNNVHNKSISRVQWNAVYVWIYI